MLVGRGKAGAGQWGGGGYSQRRIANEEARVSYGGGVVTGIRGEGGRGGWGRGVRLEKEEV